MNSETPPIAEPHSEYGAPLLERRPRVATWLLIGGLTCLVAALFLMGGTLQLIAPRPGTHPSVIGALATGLLPLPFAAAMLWMVSRKLATRVTFFERGAVMRRFGRDRATMSYEETGMLQLAKIRQYLNGIYGGTVFTIVLQARAGCGQGENAIVVSGKHKEHAKGLGFSPLYQRFEGQDEIDVLGIIIARAMVTRLLRDEPAAEVAWGPTAILGPDGLHVRKGKEFQPVVSYSRVSEVRAGNEGVAVFARGVPEPILVVSMVGPNALVGLEFLRAMVQRHVVEDAPEEAMAA